MADPKLTSDPRLTPARPDLAAKYLEGKVTAARFVKGVEYEVFDPIAPVRGTPSHDAPLQTEALKGERVTIKGKAVLTLQGSLILYSDFPPRLSSPLASSGETPSLHP